MTYLETNLRTIARTAKLKEYENQRFRAFLKMQDDNIDPIVQQLHDKITDEIDCTKCGNCCNSLHPSVTKPEISRLAKALNMSDKTFEKQHLETDEFDQKKYMSDTPCLFLKDKKCSIYTERPEDCRGFPFTDKPEFTRRTITMLYYYEICPIVYNLMEALKHKLGFFDFHQDFDL